MKFHLEVKGTNIERIVLYQQNEN